jgi:hypothetical protein
MADAADFGTPVSRLASSPSENGAGRAMLCGSGRARCALDLRCAQVGLAESRAFRRARLIPDQAPRGFAPGTPLAVFALPALRLIKHRSPNLWLGTLAAEQ